MPQFGLMLTEFKRQSQTGFNLYVNMYSGTVDAWCYCTCMILRENINTKLEIPASEDRKLKDSKVIYRKVFCTKSFSVVHL